ncbi:MAG: DUF3168 domain-containing protein [Betaproteobacteria bacterium]|nr:DUF3168 domain-containing protein [Betaproteobacteria bacterium]
MSLAQILYARLSTTAGVTSLVSTRISPDLRRADGELPAIVFEIDREERLQLLAAAPRYSASVRCLCMADQLSDAYAIADSVIASLNGLTNYSPSGFPLMVIQFAGLTAKSEIGIAPEPPPNDTDAPRVVAVEFFVLFTLT